MTRAVSTLLKYGYFTLFRLKTKTVTRGDELRNVLMVVLKKTEEFEKNYTTYKEEAQAKYLER